MRGLTMDWTTLLAAILGSGVLSAVINVIFEKFRNDRELQGQRIMRGFEDKLTINRMIIDLIAEFLNDFNIYLETGQPIAPEKLYAFNNLRMRTFGYLCIYADQKAIDAHESLIEYIYDVLEGNAEGEWSKVRERALDLLNAFRLDYDSKLLPAAYNGNR